MTTKESRRQLLDALVEFVRFDRSLKFTFVLSVSFVVKSVFSVVSRRRAFTWLASIGQRMK